MGYNIKRGVKYDLTETQNPQIKALQQLGFEYIIIGSQEKRIYAFFDIEVGLLRDYAKHNRIALNSNLFPNFIISKLESNVFYKI